MIEHAAYTAHPVSADPPRWAVFYGGTRLTKPLPGDEGRQTYEALVAFAEVVRQLTKAEVGE